MSSSSASAASSTLSPNAKSISGANDFPNNHIISVKQFNRSAVEYTCTIAKRMQQIVEKRYGCDLLKHRILANTFYEPSTRTSTSFASAMLRLGGQVVQINESTSSAAKGETLSDSVKALQCYADVIVLRHPQQGSANIASIAASKPVLNAGDGIGEHPTQALLDIVTIMAEHGRIDGLTITMVGDLKHGRTVHSLARVLALFKVRLNYVSPSSLSMPDYVLHDINTLSNNSIEQRHYTTLEPDVLAHTDVLYVTRVQKERFTSLEEYENLKHYFIITRTTLQQCKDKMSILHPLPRVGEITEEVDNDPRAAYFRQMQYGLYLRMALLALVLGVTEEDICKITG